MTGLSCEPLLFPCIAPLISTPSFILFHFLTTKLDEVIADVFSDAYGCGHMGDKTGKETFFDAWRSRPVVLFNDHLRKVMMLTSFIADNIDLLSRGILSLRALGLPIPKISTYFTMCPADAGQEFLFAPFWPPFQPPRPKPCPLARDGQKPLELLRSWILCRASWYVTMAMCISGISCIIFSRSFANCWTQRASSTPD